MTEVRNFCSICNNTLSNIYELPNIPVKLSCCNKNENYKYNQLSYAQCTKCNTIQLDKLIPLNVLYETSHNFNSIGKTWEDYFYLIINLINQNITNKNVLEIGCPSGKIALKVENYKKWYIVDANKNKNINFNEKICFIECFFDESFNVNDNIDLIIHSHLFEHIYEPNKFLKKCYELLNHDGEMIFGVPNMQHISEQELSLFQGIFFEHNIFLNKENITYMLNKNGFELLNIIDYKDHSTIYHVKKQFLKIHNANNNVEFKITNYYNKFLSSTSNYISFIDKCNSIINNTTKPVYIFGASYNTQLLLSMGIMNTHLSGILDNCIEKQNKFLYGFNLTIYSPNLLSSVDSIVILKNGYYVDEILEQIKQININTEIII